MGGVPGVGLFPIEQVIQPHFPGIVQGDVKILPENVIHGRPGRPENGIILCRRFLLQHPVPLPIGHIALSIDQSRVADAIVEQTAQIHGLRPFIVAGAGLGIPAARGKQLLELLKLRLRQLVGLRLRQLVGLRSRMGRTAHQHHHTQQGRKQGK